MRIIDPKIVAKLAEMNVELQHGAALADLTSLGIGGTADLLRIRKHESLPDLLTFLHVNHVPHKFLGGGSNLLVGDGELPWVVLQLVRPEPDVVLDGSFAHVDAAADLGRMITFCAKNDLGGMEGLIGVPGTVGGALRMNAGAYGMQIGSYVREVKLYRAASRKIEVLRDHQISFEYRHTSFAPDDMMLSVILELPSKPFKLVLEGILI
jgi:UDP-N-acetylmuramate dehydrogenase